MNKELRKRHDAQKRAHGVGTGHSELFDATPGGKKTLATLGSTVTDVDGLGTEQEQARIDRQDAAADCRTLVTRFRPIAFRWLSASTYFPSITSAAKIEKRCCGGGRIRP